MLPTRSTTALGLSAVALFAAAGGPAVAADATSSAFRTLTGKQVKDNSLTGKDIRNGTLTVKNSNG